MQMRAAGATGSADRAQALALLDPLSDFYIQSRKMQKHRAHAVAVVEHQGAASEL